MVNVATSYLFCLLLAPFWARLSPEGNIQLFSGKMFNQVYLFVCLFGAAQVGDFAAAVEVDEAELQNQVMKTLIFLSTSDTSQMKQLLELL